jgi:hypothetical protein
MRRLPTSWPRALDTVRLWRDSWVGLQGIDLECLQVAERLQDAPRAGAPARIAAVACEAPSKAGRPISQWTTGREIADELKARGIVEQISPRHASYLREVWGLQPHRFRYWLTEVPDQRREERSVEGCQVYAQAAERARGGERSINLDELTGVQAIERKHPDLPMQAGHVLRREAGVYPARNVVLGESISMS